MTNTQKLEEAIGASGVTYVFLADKLGITRQSLYSKIGGKTEFKASEIAMLASVLHLTPKQRDSIFFARSVI